MGKGTELPALCCLVLLTAGARAGVAQEPEVETRLRVDVSLATIPVTITDSRGAPVAGLTRDNFRIFEDGAERNVAFLAAEDRPVSVCLVFDLSASMRHKMPAAIAVMAQLLQSFDDPDDDYCLIVFNEKPTIAVGFARNAQAVTDALSKQKPVGRTALLDAIQLAARHMRVSRNARKVIVVISDGGDNHSRLTREEVLRQLPESDAQVYALSIPPPASKNPAVLAIEELNGPALLEEITKETGGRHIAVTKVEDLPQTCAEIARRMHSEYLLGFAPPVHDGRTHRLEVKITGPGVADYRVSYRTALFIPAHPQTPAAEPAGSVH